MTSAVAMTRQLPHTSEAEWLKYNTEDASQAFLTISQTGKKSYVSRYYITQQQM